MAIPSIALCLYVLSIRLYPAPSPRPVLFILPYNPEQCHHTLCAHDRDRQTYEQLEATHACYFESVVYILNQVWYKVMKNRFERRVTDPGLPHFIVLP